MQKIVKMAAAGAVVALAFVLAIGVVTGSNMGFKLEKTFEVVPGNGNIYMTSFPFFASFPDANASTYVPNPNGVVDSEDALRDMWEGTDMGDTRDGTMEIQRIDNSAGVNRLFFTGIQTNAFTGATEIYGDEVFTLEPDAGDTDRAAEGYIIKVNGPTDCATQLDCPMNQSVIVGSHDVSFDATGIDMPYVAGNRNWYFINVPYHTTYTDAYNVLCGPESGFAGRDATNGWPVDGGGLPVCPAGTWNAVDPNEIFSYDNSRAPFGGFWFLGVQLNAFTGATEFYGDLGDVWPLIPGEAYAVKVSDLDGNPANSPTSNFTSPHF